MSRITPGGRISVYLEPENCARWGIPEESEIEARCLVSDYDPGRISGPPERCYPSEGGEAELDALYFNGKKIDDSLLTEKELEDIIIQAQENYEPDERDWE